MLRREELGDLLVYTLVLTALVTVLVAGLMIHASGRTNQLLTLVLAGTLVASLGLSFQARRDLDAALTFCTGFGLAVAICATVYLFSTNHPSQAAQFLTVTGSVVGIGTGIWTFMRQRTHSSEIPDVLARSYPALEAQETVGIQFVAYLLAAESSGPHTAVLVLQNCYDAPRRVVVKLDGGGDRKYLQYPESVEVELNGAQVVRVGIPVVSPDYDGSYKLYYDLSISGSGGSRVRLGRRKAMPKRVSPTQTSLLLLIGLLHFGGGNYFTVPRLHRDLWNRPLPQASTKILWEPPSQSSADPARYLVNDNRLTRYHR